MASYRSDSKIRQDKSATIRLSYRRKPVSRRWFSLSRLRTVATPTWQNTAPRVLC